MRLKQKSPFLRIKKKRAFTIWASRFTSFTTKKIFGKTLQAGLLTGGSSYLLRLPLAKRQRVALATFVTDYSGGTVPFTPVKYSETTDFHRLHRKNLRNQCNLRLLLNWSWDSLLVPINIGTPVCCYLILHLYYIVSPFRINPSIKAWRGDS